MMALADIRFMLCGFTKRWMKRRAAAYRLERVLQHVAALVLTRGVERAELLRHAAAAAAAQSPSDYASHQPLRQTSQGGTPAFASRKTGMGLADCDRPITGWHVNH